MTLFVRRAETLLAIAATLAILVLGVQAAMHFKAYQQQQDDQIRKLVPASNWLEVRMVHIEDSTTGTPPLLRVDRSIHRPFRGEWHVTVRRTVESGDGFAVCVAEGSSDYSEAANFPPPEHFNLDWWTHPTKCNLQPGRYRAYTLWRIFPDGYPEKQVRSVSNAFTIK